MKRGIEWILNILQQITLVHLRFFFVGFVLLDRVFSMYCLPCCSFPVAHCVISLSTIYWLWLRLWYLRVLLENSEVLSKCNQSLLLIRFHSHEFEFWIYCRTWLSRGSWHSKRAKKDWELFSNYLIYFIHVFVPNDWQQINNGIENRTATLFFSFPIIQHISCGQITTSYNYLFYI